MDTTPRERLVIVEDDPVTRAVIAGYFIDQGFHVQEAETIAQARRTIQRFKPELIFIDVVLPDGDGFELAKELQSVSDAGIIFVTRRDADIDRIVGLELAGDHYVNKPVDLRDLLARTRSLLRRRKIERDMARRSTTATFGPFIMDFLRRELATINGDPIRLTRGEFDLLAALVESDGRPLSRDYLIEVVSNRFTDVDARSVDALVARLRRKLGQGGKPGMIATVSGIGYKLGVPVERNT
ncbi:response regulator [Bosea sp. BIWAKO-01]|uniref:response regulator n=1 Tax=Bosea sp. BIWAKO-01 TaxID=506668 RepID=UPI000852ACD3|nr:response regulator [Bosea sp. BIWAKO-01]GAU82966.1 two-component response regulator [Bosea sp. BIWAKO-01]